MTFIPVILLCAFLMNCPAGTLSVDGSDPQMTMKLVEMIQKKQYEPFVKELTRKNMDVNQPTPKGLMPIIEAAKTMNIKFVDSLIQFGADIRAKEPGSEITALMVAVQSNFVDMTELLLSYGAEPTMATKSGKKPMDIMTSPAMKHMYDLWSKGGAMAYEDEPGQWMRASEKGTEYWYNKLTDEGRWNMPPSCGWQRVEVKGGPDQYMNYVTGQKVLKTPNALAWRKFRQGGVDVWYNWALNITQTDAPDEMPQFMIEEASQQTNVRWFNEKTKEFTWEDPKLKTHWKVISEEGKEKYYFNLASGESQYEVPEELAWTKHEHEGSHYWHNTETGSNTWDLPEHEAWVLQDEEL